MKAYTVEVEVLIYADSPQGAWEDVSFALAGTRNVISVGGLCEPYTSSVEEDDESN